MFHTILSTLLASLSFSTYVPPPSKSSYTSNGNKLKVSYLTQEFLKQTHKGVLTITPLSITSLPSKINPTMIESTLTNSFPDVYILASTFPKSSSTGLSKKVNSGLKDMTVDTLCRSSTIWSNSKNTTYTRPEGGILGVGGKDGSVDMRGVSPLVMYVSKGDELLGVSVMDEEVSKDDECVGSFVVGIEEVKGRMKVKLGTRGERKVGGGQKIAGAVVGGMAGGPAGAVVGGVVAGMIEEGVKGEVEFESNFAKFGRERGGGEGKNGKNGKGGKGMRSAVGCDWGGLCEEKVLEDLEQICYLENFVTGCTAGLYRSSESKTVVVAFRGTCEPKDLIVDGNVLQTDWVEGVKESEEKVHTGFRTSLESVCMKLKWLIGEACGGEKEIEGWNLKITGHSLGGALAILFCRDVAEGFDCGRGLPQYSEESALSKLGNFLTNKKQGDKKRGRHFKTCEVYTFGSPRVGNGAFCDSFDSLLLKDSKLGRPKISAAWRVVNNKDVVARLPRTVDGLIFGKIGYEHVGRTVLISGEEGEGAWIEGVSEGACPVRDGVIFSSPLTTGNVLGDVVSIVARSASTSEKITDKLNSAIDGVTGRVNNINSVMELASLVGIDVGYAEREARIMESLVKGEGLADHMEPEYWRAFGGVVGGEGSGDESSE
ncbi:hypothetical protein TrST_g930 [Triparma strigata]|uniref:Fungal lipase-type domain-containing protein n=1 Tax=Triparma strigata TaxID=1606541 RepID=A0A9W7BYS0_9STRA|nr:hypothetical protein TrST_g930 [Triparma strigata]